MSPCDPLSNSTPGLFIPSTSPLLGLSMARSPAFTSAGSNIFDWLNFHSFSKLCIQLQKASILIEALRKRYIFAICPGQQLAALVSFRSNVKLKKKGQNLVSERFLSPLKFCICTACMSWEIFSEPSLGAGHIKHAASANGRHWNRVISQSGPWLHMITHNQATIATYWTETAKRSKRTIDKRQIGGEKTRSYWFRNSRWRELTQ